MRRVPCIWYHVDEGDSDLPSFFYYLGLAAKRLAPRKRKSLPFLTPEYLHGIPAFSRRFFENLYSRLERAPAGSDSRSGSPVGRGRPSAVIVFDNYQEVPESSPLHEALYEGFCMVPGGTKVVLISRKEPPEAFVRLRANSRMKTVGWDDLRFTLDESNRMVRLRGCGSASADALRRLHEKTRGWAAGIVLLLEEAKTEGIESVLSRVHPPKEIFRYFAREIFDRSEPGTRDFLVKTAFFPRMSAEMAENLTGNESAGLILSELNQKGYFTQRLESETAFYQYHPLLREFLSVLARETLTPAGLAELGRKAAFILEENDQVEDALELLRKAEDWTDCVKLIVKHAPGFSILGRSGTLDGWIRGLPQATVEAEPWLLYWSGICRLPYAPAEARVFFEKSFGMFRTKRDVPGVFLSLAGLFDCVFYSLGTYQPFDDVLVLLDQVLAEYGSFPSLQIEARLTLCKLYALGFRQPWNPELAKATERARSILPMIADANIRARVIHCLLGQQLLLGEVEKARVFIEMFRGLVRTWDVSPLHRKALKLSEAMYYAWKGEFSESRKVVEEALELAAETGIHIADTFLFGYGAAASLNTGDLEAADLFIHRMSLSLDQTNFWGRQFFHVLCAWKLLLSRNVSSALFHAEISLKFAIDAGVPHTITYSYFVYALVLHELGRYDEAGEHLARCREVADSIGSRIIEFLCFLTESRFAFDRGDAAAGLSLLREGLALGRDKGYVSTFFIWLPSIMAELCLRAVEAGIEVDYVRHLIRKRNLMPDPAPVDSEKWPWELKIFTLGCFEIVRDGQPVRFPGKVQKKPLEILKALTANVGGGMSEEQITDWLWPDAHGDAAHSVFTTTLSRLRRLVGVEGAIRFHEGRISLDPRCCWTDAVAFEKIAARLDKLIAVPDAGIESILGLIAKAVDLYRGNFLPADEGLSWTFSYRERLRGRFCQLINRAGEWLEKAERWETAVMLYQKGIDTDCLSEEFYQRLMICFRKLGRDSNAVDVYNRWRKLLAASMGIEPSARTRAIYDSIKGG